MHEPEIIWNCPRCGKEIPSEVSACVCGYDEMVSEEVYNAVYATINKEALNDIIYARTGCRDIKQYIDEQN